MRSCSPPKKTPEPLLYHGVYLRQAERTRGKTPLPPSACQSNLNENDRFLSHTHTHMVLAATALFSWFSSRQRRTTIERKLSIYSVSYKNERKTPSHRMKAINILRTKIKLKHPANHPLDAHPYPYPHPHPHRPTHASSNYKAWEDLLSSSGIPKENVIPVKTELSPEEGEQRLPPPAPIRNSRTGSSEQCKQLTLRFVSLMS